MPAAGSGRTRKTAAGGRGGRQKKVPRAGPKKALTAYLLYDRTRREQLVKERPELRSNVTEMSKIIGAEWRQMSDDQKAPFQREHEKDKERYMREKKEFENSQQLKAVSGPSGSHEMPAPKPVPAESRQKRPPPGSGVSNEEEDEEEKRFDEEDEEDEDENHAFTERAGVEIPEGHRSISSRGFGAEESGEQSGSPTGATTEASLLNHGSHIVGTAGEEPKSVSSFASTQPSKHSAAPYLPSSTESGSESVALSPPPSKRFRPSTDETGDDNNCQLQDATQTSRVDDPHSPGNAAAADASTTTPTLSSATGCLMTNSSDMEPYVAAA